jgi:hypothetical protein
MFFSRRRFPIDTHRNAPRRLRDAKSRRRRVALGLELLEPRRLLAAFTVNSTADDASAPVGDPSEMTLRMAIADSNSIPGPNTIGFNIPSSDAGFDPETQDWTITLTNGPLPAITTPVTIDGFTQAHDGISYRYPDEYTSEVQSLVVDPAATAGTFLLTLASYVDDDGITRGGQATIPYNASAGEVQSELLGLAGVSSAGVNNVLVTGTSVNSSGGVTIAFQGAATGLAIPVMTVSDIDPAIPDVTVGEVTAGGTAQGNPTEITSSPNSDPATTGNNAVVRVIVDGSQTGGATGFEIDASASTLRGLIIDGFGTGVEVASTDTHGNPVRGVLIQGNYIGASLLYPVDLLTGSPLPAPDNEQVDLVTNSGPGVVVDGLNTTLGGPAPQDDNVIAGNGGPGVEIDPGAEGNQVLENQIGVIGPSGDGVYYPVGNQAQGVLVESSSNLIGASGAGNVISVNSGDGIEILQTVNDGATQNVIAGNEIGTAPGGGYIFGNGDPGNQGNGVEIQDAPNNVIGGSTAGAGNVISSNSDAGVNINGAAALGNVISSNIIGLIADGGQVLGNLQQGVAVSSSDTQVGPGNVISDNLIGVSISGTTSSGSAVQNVTVIGNLIGTDITGEVDLGNAFQGVLVDGASGVTIQGNAAGSQVISGNTIGVDIEDSASDNLVEGNLIGTDKTGTLELPNSKQGVLIDDSSGNTIGGTGSTSKNLISSNHSGVDIEDSASDNLVEGNLIGTDITGQLPLGNEVDGVTIAGSSGNTIGGIGSNAANTIAFNSAVGVGVQSGTGDAILSNSIASNGGPGIDLAPAGNDLLAAPAITAAMPNVATRSTNIQGTYSAQADSTYLIQFFSNTTADSSGDYEGQTLIGSIDVSTGADGDVHQSGNVAGTFSVSLSTLVASGSWITSTATYLVTTIAIPSLHIGDTSAFTAVAVIAEPVSRFIVTSTADTMASGTLRDAITESNQNPGTSIASPNQIVFQISGSGAQTIELQSPLPAITAPVIIDGYSQSGSSVNTETVADNATILIQIDGSSIPSATDPEADGLDIETYNCTVDGLSITDFSGSGIALEPPANPVPPLGAIGADIRGDWIGVSPDGSVQANLEAGVIAASSNNDIGGLLPASRDVIQGNSEAGVILYGPDGTGNLVQGDFILNNGGDGVLVLSGNNQVGQPIGAGTAGGGDVISGNHSNGVFILGSAAQGNLIDNDLIGTTPDGTQRLPNEGDGVLIENAPGNVVGGTGTNTLNVIAGNAGEGVMIANDQGNALPVVPNQVSSALMNAGYSVDSSPTGATANRVEGNWIGFDLTSQVYLLPNTDGVFIASSGNTVGGSTTAARNIIIDNNRDGVVVSSNLLDSSNDALGAVLNAQPELNVIAGNFIGTEGGDDNLGNTLEGIFLYGAASNTIGGPASDSLNVISGNNGGIAIESGGTNLVIGNEIGTTSDGTQPLPNATDGITIDSSSSNTIGGASSGSGNVISGNKVGVHVTQQGSSGNVVWGNLIGTDAQGIDPVRNTSDGVLIDAGASNNTIGGTGSGEANTIAFNTGDGVLVVSGNGDAILTNAIFSNGLIGISLIGTANDSIEPPTLTAALPDTALNSTNIQGTYSGQPSSTYVIQFFSNTEADPSGHYEGQTFIGSTTLKTNASGQVIGTTSGTFSVDLGTVVTPGSWVTATVTFLSPPPSPSGLTGGDTSEFAGATEAVNPFLITSSADTNTVGSLRYAITFSNANPSPSASTPNQIEFQIPAGGLQTIELTSVLPTISQPVVIDGYSQPGSAPNDSLEFQPPGLDDDQETDIATILIQVDGSQIDGAGVDGFVVDSPSCTIDGLSITGFGGAAIALEPASAGASLTGTLGDTVWGNFIGVSQFNSRSFNLVASANNPNANGVGIVIDSPSNVIGGANPIYRNLIQGNTGDGVIVYGVQGTGNTFASNFILDNGGDGVLLLSADNHVGQSSAAAGPAGAGNVISGNQGNGVHILGPLAKGNTVANNEIGTQIGLAGLLLPIRGTTARPNTAAGILIEDAPANVVGGQILNSGNDIAGNGSDGVLIENYVDGAIPGIIAPQPMFTSNTDGSGNIVQGNNIGFSNETSLDVTIPNQEDGVYIASSGNLVGGNAPAARNIIVGNGHNGVTIDGTQLPNARPTLNVVAGNYIGTILGNDDYGNNHYGIDLDDAGDNTVGGTSSAAGNVVANNSAGIVLEGTGSTGNLVAANLVGTTSDGSAPLGNASEGIELLNSPANIIGGTAAGAGNVIAGTSNGNGVFLSGANATGNVLWGNFIGTNSDGADLLGNSGDGVAIDTSASNNTIGGTMTGAGNTIAFNAATGVGISSGTGNTILSNAIDANAQLGIVLSGTGNDAQAAPALAAAVPTATSTLIEGSLTSVPGTSFLIQLFSNATADPSGFGQGQTLIDSTVVTTDSSGGANINLTLPNVLATGLAVSATATNFATGDTSAFSNDVLPAPVDVEFTAAAFSANESSGSATISVTRSGNMGATFSVSYATSDGTAQAGLNYSATQGTLVFNPQQTLQTFTIPLATNNPPSGDLTINLSLSGPTGGANLGTPSAAVLTIVDARPIVVEFGASAYTDDESTGSAIITVTRNSPSGTSTVAYATGGGTALPGVEYTAVAGTLTFSPGATTATFAVPLEGILNQAGQWTVGLTLSDPNGATLGNPAAATLNLTAESGAVEFGAAAVTVPESAGAAVIAVYRVGGSSGTIAVNYAAGAGSAIPGVDFTPVSGTLTFPPGVMAQSFTLPVLANSANPYDATVALTLGGPTGGAVLGTPSIEIVTIDKPLVVTSEQLSINGAGIAAITFAFNKPLNPSQAQNPANFGSFVIAAGPGGVFGPAASGSTPIQSAIYNPSNLTVTVTPSAVLPFNHLDRIVIDERANPLLNNGLTDANGNLLTGSDGVAGSPFVTNFGAGTRLAYVDGIGNVVTLQLSRGGLMELFQFPDGSIQQLELVGTNKKSTLTGTVRRGPHPGRTALPAITGTAGVRIRLKPPAFISPKSVPSAIAEKAEPSARIVRPDSKSPRPFSRRRWRR